MTDEETRWKEEAEAVMEKDIRKAMHTLEKAGGKAVVIRMSPEMLEKVQRLGIETNDGYVFGMKIILDDLMEPDRAYVEGRS